MAATDTSASDSAPIGGDADGVAAESEATPAPAIPSGTIDASAHAAEHTDKIEAGQDVETDAEKHIIQDLEKDAENDADGLDTTHIVHNSHMNERTDEVENLLDSETRRLQLPEDIYMSCWLHFLIYTEHNWTVRVAQLLLMLSVTAIQIIALTEASNHPINMWVDKVNLWNHAAAALLHTNTSMPLAISQEICGTFEQREYRFGSNSTVKMEDGTTLTPDTTIDGIPVFRNVKLPSNTWLSADFGNRNSHLDEALYVVGGGPRNTMLWDDGTVSYLATYLVMTTALFYVFMGEVRELAGFAAILLYFSQKGFARPGEKCVDSSLNLENLAIRRINSGAAIVGWLIVGINITIAALFLLIGTTVTMFCSTKMDLIMNSLALGFILAMDHVAYVAFMRDTVKTIIASADPVEFKPVNSKIFGNQALFRVGTIGGGILYCIASRCYQKRYFLMQLQTVMGLCLLAGPQPSDIPVPMLAPASGLCESLISATCAPNVNGVGSKHGHCMVVETDRERLVLDPDSAFSDPQYMAHVDNGNLYPDMGWTSLSEPVGDLKLTWGNNAYVANMRKFCLKAYQPEFKPDVRVVDINSAEVMYGGPFFCPREHWDSSFKEADKTWREEYVIAMKYAGGDFSRSVGASFIRKTLVDFRTVLFKGDIPSVYDTMTGYDYFKGLPFLFNDMQHRCRMHVHNKTKVEAAETDPKQTEQTAAETDPESNVAPKADAQTADDNESSALMAQGVRSARSVQLDHRGRSILRQKGRRHGSAHLKAVEQAQRGGMHLLRSANGRDP